MQMPAKTASDHSLLQRYRRGLDDAPDLLYRRYAERLRTLAARQTSDGLSACVDPEDIVQSVFRTFFRGAAEGQYDVPEGEEIWKLLMVITLNKVRALGNFHRAARRDLRRTVGGATYDRAVESESGHDETALTVLRLVVDELLEALPPARRSIVELRVEGYEVAEIARRTGRSKRTVERVLQEFCHKLDAQIREGE
jgi:RNA polymerase sigma-70 factor (ECF subfamily)